MKKSTIWKIQLGFGIFLLIYFAMAEYTLPSFDECYKYLIAGFAGMSFVWGIREVLGALAKHRECIKDEKEDTLHN